MYHFDPYTKEELAQLEVPRTKEDSMVHQGRLRATASSMPNLSQTPLLKRVAGLSSIRYAPSSLSKMDGFSGEVFNAAASNSDIWTAPGLASEHLIVGYNVFDPDEANGPKFVHFNGLQFSLNHQYIEWKHQTTSLASLYDEVKDLSVQDVQPSLGISYCSFFYFDQSNEEDPNYDNYNLYEQESRWTFKPLTSDNGTITSARFDLKYKSTVSDNGREYFAGSLYVKMVQTRGFLEYEFIPKVIKQVGSLSGSPFDSNVCFVSLRNFNTDKTVQETLRHGAYVTNKTSLTSDESSGVLLLLFETNYGNSAEVPFHSAVARIHNSAYGLGNSTLSPVKVLN